MGRLDLNLPELFSADRVWSRQPPADDAEIQNLLRCSQARLPGDYIEFLCASNGGEGELAIEPGWFVLWRAAEVLVNNEQYNVREFFPGYFAIGSNGGGEMFAFEIDRRVCTRVVMLPFIGSTSDAVVVGESFADFAFAIGQRLRS